jgi:hypothetical protein
MMEDECARGTSIGRDQIEKRSRAASECSGKNALVVGASSGEIPKTFGSPVGSHPFYGKGACAAEQASDRRSFWRPRPRRSHPKTTSSRIASSIQGECNCLSKAAWLIYLTVVFSAHNTY